MSGLAPALVMGSFIALGGTAGYLKKGSVASIASGVGCGLAYLYAAYLINGGAVEQGNRAALAVSLLVGAVFFARALKWSPKPAMAFVIAGLSLVSAYAHWSVLQ
jgi:uncharacterized membrane protein (UPF0136 family)